MAVTTNKQVWPQAQKFSSAICTAAKTTYNDATNAVLLVTAGADGSVVTSITAIPRATVTATQLQLFISPDSGTTLYLINTALMPAYTMAATTQAVPVDFGYTVAAPLRIAATNRLYVGAGVALAGGIVFNASYQDY
jgi:hypothetical protein